MLSERYLQKRFRDGEQIGSERTRREFLDWLERRDAATAAGVPFDEPPPGVEASGSRSANGNGTSATAGTATNGTDPQPRHLADLESWYIRKGIAEDMGVPFNEPHPIRSNGNGTV